MSNQQNIANFFVQIQRRIEDAVQLLPDAVGNEVRNHARDNFATSSFEGEKWKPRKSKRETHGLLLKTERLRDSVNILSKGHNSVVVGSQVKYASIHNYGGTINRMARSETFLRNRHTRGPKKGLFQRGTTSGQGQTYKAHSITMPQRKFLGASPKLKLHLQNTIKEILLKATND